MKRSLDPDVRLLSALADPTRLAIVRELAAAPEVCACDFTTCCDVSQPTVSHHLRILREAGVVTAERRGTWIFYRLDPAVSARLARIAEGLVPGGLIPVSSLRRGRPAGSASSTPVESGDGSGARRSAALEGVRRNEPAEDTAAG